MKLPAQAGPAVASAARSSGKPARSFIDSPSPKIGRTSRPSRRAWRGWRVSRRVWSVLTSKKPSARDEADLSSKTEQAEQIHLAARRESVLRTGQNSCGRDETFLLG